MEPYYSHAGIEIYHADCREVLPTLQPCDLVLADIPYGEVNREAGGLRNLDKGNADEVSFELAFAVEQSTRIGATAQSRLVNFARALC